MVKHEPCMGGGGGVYGGVQVHAGTSEEGGTCVDKATSGVEDRETGSTGR